MINLRIDEEDVVLDASGHVFHQGEPFTGVTVATSQDGRVVSTHSYFAGYPDGPYQEWRSPDLLRKEGQMRNGIPIGTHREWHPNGQIATESDFDDHGSQVDFRAWDENGIQI
ncbi:hypothetical protein GCM10027271_57250 [Saccharopolyspora gloriosae]|uniref:Antitoxin component YwqK of YwqJK toxin-antitoxin module n=1 Tax=Saccharopolyspora gloriosae TaxID=455344 RepID=A0A840NEQ1_9PSEU|nr:hypothetical protein [Saccharopolyspora gloriosae]MBB5067809.1 antitoxin component YwqK of YwqJK toxin-antitoxin module [Saccharopolyspora gloriosae]